MLPKCLLVLFAAVCPAATLRIGSVPQVVSVGGTINVPVLASGVQDLYAYQFDVAFEPGVLSVSGVLEQTFLVSGGGATVFSPGTIDNLAGTIAFTTSSLLGQTTGVSGTGPLVEITFTGIEAGASPLVLSNVLLLNSALQPIDVSIGSSSVSVTQSAVPEPASGALLAAALMGLILLRGKTRDSTL